MIRENNTDCATYTARIHEGDSTLEGIFTGIHITSPIASASKVPPSSAV